MISDLDEVDSLANVLVDAVYRYRALTPTEEVALTRLRGMARGATSKDAEIARLREENEKLLFTSDRQAVAWKGRALKAEARTGALSDILDAAARFDDKPHHLFSAVMRAAQAENYEDAARLMDAAYSAPSTHALNRRIGVLREALKPFAALAQAYRCETMEFNRPDERRVFGLNDARVTVGHLRAALAALEEM